MNYWISSLCPCSYAKLRLNYSSCPCSYAKLRLTQVVWSDKLQEKQGSILKNSYAFPSWEVLFLAVSLVLVVLFVSLFVNARRTTFKLKIWTPFTITSGTKAYQSKLQPSPSKKIDTPLIIHQAEKKKINLPRRTVAHPLSNFVSALGFNCKHRYNKFKEMVSKWQLLPVCMCLCLIWSQLGQFCKGRRIVVLTDLIQICILLYLLLSRYVSCKMWCWVCSVE